MVIPGGFGVTITGGDLWVRNNGAGRALIGRKLMRIQQLADLIRGDRLGDERWLGDGLNSGVRPLRYGLDRGERTYDDGCRYRFDRRRRNDLRYERRVRYEDRQPALRYSGWGWYLRPEYSGADGRLDRDLRYLRDLYRSVRAYRRVSLGGLVQGTGISVPTYVPVPYRYRWARDVHRQCQGRFVSSTTISEASNVEPNGRNIIGAKRRAG